MGNSTKKKKDCTIGNVTVYASSSDNVPQIYRDQAYGLGKEIAHQGWIQVNGGGEGLMGAATRGALETGGLVQCVTNRMFVDETLYKVGFSNIIITDTMPERKEGLWSKADAFICLPGGLGTLDEIAEIMCRRQLSLHYRPIVFLNTNGFYEFIKSFLRQCVNDKFIARNIDQTVHFADNPVDAVAWLNTYEYVYIDAISMKSKEMENAEKSQIGQ